MWKRKAFYNDGKDVPKGEWLLAEEKMIDFLNLVDPVTFSFQAGGEGNRVYLLVYKEREVRD